MDWDAGCGATICRWNGRRRCRANRPRPPANDLLQYLDALPESGAVLDLAGRGLGLRVIPGSIWVALAVHLHVVVAGGAFPRTHCLVIAGLEIFAVNGLHGEVLIAFHLDRLVRFSENGSVPGCLWHSNPFRLQARPRVALFSSPGRRICEHGCDDFNEKLWRTHHGRRTPARVGVPSEPGRVVQRRRLAGDVLPASTRLRDRAAPARSAM